MKYRIVLKDCGKTAEYTNIEFKSLKKAREWKSEWESLKTGIECFIYKGKICIG